MEQDDVGLGDLSSEAEGTVDSDRGSMIDSEGKDEELEEFGDVSEDDQRPKITLISDEEDDLFGDSEKGEEDEDSEENAKLKKKRPASFTDELAARIKVDMLSKPEEEQLYDDIFMPPKLTDEDFLPFASKEDLFGGGTGLFDNEESDLFAELPKVEATVEKETRAPINDGRNDVFSPSFLMEKEDKKLIEPITDKAEKFHGSIGLFDDDELKSNNTNSVSACSKQIPLQIDMYTYLFKSLPSSTENFKPFTQTPSKDQKSLFCDEEDSEDLFSSNQSIKPNNSSSSSSKVIARTPLSLFDEEDEEDRWNNAEEVNPASEFSQKRRPTQTASVVSHTTKKCLFEEEGEEDLFAVTEER
ncbi:hypothetical protein JD844_031809 [Phrynosoma platyrhinos]|uniref:Uncharacterized protein n=1 Tax=Phrynosoma platyrhinos TaxID=52577 RepID=A0ABQ7T3V1_PHRPL|nr:hypothetical protein JD844_031809 [Phrynosoma platyrhinos]